MGFGLDTRGRDWRDDAALHFAEADRDCLICSRPIPRGTQCQGCQLEEGGES
jgi:hypothetical protein